MPGKIKTVIVDDEPKNIRILRKLIEDYCPQLRITGEAGDVQAAYSLIQELKPSLVLLDIQMPFGNAFDLLDKLMPINFEVVFITAYDNYSIKAIKYSALDYLLKPVDIKELQLAAEKAAEKIADKRINEQVAVLLANIKNPLHNLQKIAIPTIEGLVFVQVDDIIRFEASGSYTNIFTIKKETIVASKNIKEYEELLPPAGFFRIHHSHLININRIIKYNKGRGGTVTMEDGAEIEVASRRRSDFLDIFK